MDAKLKGGLGNNGEKKGGSARTFLSDDDASRSIKKMRTHPYISIIVEKILKSTNRETNQPIVKSINFASQSKKFLASSFVYLPL